MKSLLLLSISLALIVNCGAQLHAGIRAGGQFSREQFSNPNFQSDYTTAFYAGISLRNEITERVSLQSELNFSREGSLEDSVFNGSIRRDYLNLPLLGKVMTANGLNFLTGPQLQFNLNATETFNGNRSDVKANTRPVLMSWVVGTGYEWPRWAAEFRYQQSLHSVNRGEVAGGNIKGRCLSLGLFYRLLE